MLVDALPSSAFTIFASSIPMLPLASVIRELTAQNTGSSLPNGPREGVQKVRLSQ